MSGVRVLPYDPEWPAQFARVAAELRDACGGTTLQIEHIGSTSVSGLAAKPVIDVLLGAADLRQIEQHIPQLAAQGYDYVSRYEQQIPERRYFVKAAGAGLPRIHVHGVVRGARLWRSHLVFRELLRSDAELRARYQALKLQLAREHAQDKSAYGAAKDPFIEAVLRAALAAD